MSQVESGVKTCRFLMNQAGSGRIRSEAGRIRCKNSEFFDNQVESHAKTEDFLINKKLKI